MAAGAYEQLKEALDALWESQLWRLEAIASLLSLGFLR